MDGASRGRATAASFTTALVRDLTAVLGASAKNWCGGTRKNGRASTCPDSYKENRPIMNRSSMRKASMRFPVMRHLLHEDGLGWLYVPKGLKDGPFPTHYEPLES